MSDTEVNLPEPSGKMELKVKVAGWATFVVSLLGLTALEWGTTDLIPALPASLNWLGPILGASVAAATSWVGGYFKRSRPDSLSESTVEALRVWLAKRFPHRNV